MEPPPLPSLEGLNLEDLFPQGSMPKAATPELFASGNAISCKICEQTLDLNATSRDVWALPNCNEYVHSSCALKFHYLMIDLAHEPKSPARDNGQETRYLPETCYICNAEIVSDPSGKDAWYLPRDDIFIHASCGYSRMKEHVLTESELQDLRQEQANLRPRFGIVCPLCNQSVSEQHYVYHTKVRHGCVLCAKLIINEANAIALGCSSSHRAHHDCIKNHFYNAKPYLKTDRTEMQCRRCPAHDCKGQILTRIKRLNEGPRRVDRLYVLTSSGEYEEKNSAINYFVDAHSSYFRGSSRQNL